MAQRLCLPCILAGTTAMAALGWWSFYVGDRSAGRIRTETVRRADAALAAAGAPFATSTLDDGVMHLVGTAPSQSAKDSAYVVASRAVEAAHGVPGVFATLVNDIVVQTDVVAVPPAASGPPPAADDCQARFDATLAGKVIRFETAKAVIDAASYPLLDQLAATAQTCDAYGLEIGGHTDPRGGAAYNKALSRGRAAAVVTYLVQKGARTEQLTAVGYGSERLIDSTNTPEGLARNRRIEFTVKNPNP